MRRLLLFGSLVGLIAWSIGVAENGSPNKATTQRSVERQPITKMRTAISKQARERKNPVAPTQESIAFGNNLFCRRCTNCHGISGDGKGPLVERLSLNVPDFTRIEHRRTRTDGELFFILTHGHGGMPSTDQQLADEAKWHLVNAIRAMSGPVSR